MGELVVRRNGGRYDGSYESLGTTMTARKFLKFVVVSPRDTAIECAAAFDVAEDLNDGIAAERGLYLDDWWWPKAYPGPDPEGGQGHLDKLMKIDQADLVIGIFSRLYGTVLPDGYSGTEHELRKAIAAWEQTRQPHVMVYFNTGPGVPAPADTEENEKRIAAFREFVTQKGLYGVYAGAEHFEARVRNDLTQWLRDQPQFQAHARPAPSVILEPPVFHDLMPRASATELRLALKTKPVVTLEGLSGVGKRYIASGTCADAMRDGEYRFVWWHEPDQNESLDSLLARLDSESPLGYSSPPARSRALMHHLVAAGGLLVIDDFDRVDLSSYAPLVAAARAIAPPARLLLLSNKITDVALAVADVLILKGFNEHELKTFLDSRAIKALPRRTLTALQTKTDGLPFAAALFASLVGSRGYDPETLLAGTMSRSERLRSWFASILESLAEESIALLRRLSVNERAFNQRTVRHVGRLLSLSDADAAFDELQRAYLVQTHTASRWRVHALVSTCALELMSEEEIRQAHHAFATYYSSGFPRRAARLLDHVEYSYKALAVRLFQRAGDMNAAQRLIGNLVRSAKARGAYEELIHLIEPHLSAAGHDPWLDYHYAHCCLLLGRVTTAGGIAERIDVAGAQPELQLSVARIRAEVLRATDDPVRALEVLTNALALADPTRVHGTAYAQAQSFTA